MTTNERKIAFVTDDGRTISAHFGRALYYEIVRVNEKTEVERTRIDKAGHHMWEGSGQNGPGPHEDHKHALMTAPLEGVSVLIARGMGTGAQQHLLASGIQPILTDLHTIDEALGQLLAGTLVNNPKRLHDHGHGR